MNQEEISYLHLRLIEMFYSRQPKTIKIDADNPPFCLIDKEQPEFRKVVKEVVEKHITEESVNENLSALCLGENKLSEFPVKELETGNRKFRRNQKRLKRKNKSLFKMV